MPTQLFLVPPFALAPAAAVPALVFAGLILVTLGDSLAGRSRVERVLFGGGDAVHALGPAITPTATRAATWSCGGRALPARPVSNDG